MAPLQLLVATRQLAARRLRASRKLRPRTMTASLALGMSLVLLACHGAPPPGHTRKARSSAPAFAPFRPDGRLEAAPGPVATTAALASPPAAPVQLLHRPASAWQAGGKSVSLASAEDLAASLVHAALTNPGVETTVESRGAYEQLSFLDSFVHDGQERRRAVYVLRPAAALEPTLEPLSQRGARLDAKRSAYAYDTAHDTFVSVEMPNGGTAAEAAKLRDELMTRASHVLQPQWRPTNRDYSQNGAGIYPGSAEGVWIPLQALPASLRADKWLQSATPIAVRVVGRHERIRFSRGSGRQAALFTLVRPTTPQPNTELTPVTWFRQLGASQPAILDEEADVLVLFEALESEGGAEAAAARLRRFVSRNAAKR